MGFLGNRRSALQFRRRWAVWVSGTCVAST
ncbi:hypothetical protein LINGRAHAP2_LOCUS11253 [Linum grandiflorum]